LERFVMANINQAPGLMLGIDMAFHGSWWLALGYALRRERPAIGAARPARA
jgi:hypothetical protein